jgi:MFS family permease
MRRVLAHREFRLLWLSQAGSTLGDRLVLVALALYVNEIGSPTDVGLVLAAQTVPFVALLLVGGVWADRLPRHLVMVVSDVVRGGLHAVLAVMIATGTADVWEIAVIEALYGAAHAFFRPAYTGLVPQTVPEHLLQEANAVTFMTYNVASFVGPATASAIVLTAGADVAFALDAVTFLGSAAILLRVRPRERGAPSVRSSMRFELAEGWREVRARPWVGLVVFGACVGLMLAFAPFQALGPDIADKAFGEAAVFGVVMAMFGLGSIVGSLVGLRWRPARPLVAGMVCCIPWGLNFVAFAAGLPLPALAPFSIASGVGVSLFSIWWETALATNVPPQALSRVSAFDWMGSLGLSPIGYLAAGPIAHVVGARETLIGGAVVALTVDLAILASPSVRSVRSQPKSGTPASGVEASA